MSGRLPFWTYSGLGIISQLVGFLWRLSLAGFSKGHFYLFKIKRLLRASDHPGQCAVGLAGGRPQLLTPSDCPRSEGCWAGPCAAPRTLGQPPALSGLPVLLGIPEPLSSVHSGPCPSPALLRSRSLSCCTNGCSRFLNPGHLFQRWLRLGHAHSCFTGGVHVSVRVFSHICFQVFFSRGPFLRPRRLGENFSRIGQKV